MAKAKKKDTYDVEKLLEERKTVTQWLDRLSMASDTTPEDVRVRVKGDYETRLVALNQELKGYSSQITQTLDRATAKLEELKDKEKKAEARLAEAKLRHAVGEYGESKWNEIHSTILGDLVKVREELKETNEEIVRLRDVLASIDSEALEKAQKLQEGARALAAAKAAAEARAALEAGAAERAKAEAEAKAAAEVKAALDIQKKLEEEKKAKEEAQAEAAAREKAEAEAKAKEEAEERAKREAEAKAEAESKAKAEAEAEAAAKEEEVPEADAADLPMIDDDSDATVMDSNVGEDSSFISQQSDFVSSERATGSFMAQDELPGVEDEGDGELELFDPDEPDEAPVAPSRPSFTPSGIDEPINAPLDQSGGLEAPKDNEASTKTLKCGDCGAMNLPTEWYCESCGAELAAL